MSQGDVGITSLFVWLFSFRVKKKKKHLIHPHQTLVKGSNRVSLLELLFMSLKEIIILYTYIAPCM